MIVIYLHFPDNVIRPLSIDLRVAFEFAQLDKEIQVSVIEIATGVYIVCIKL